MKKQDLAGRLLTVWLVCLGMGFIFPVQAQISEGGLPRSFGYPSLRSEPVAKEIPVEFSVEDLKTVDAWQVSQGAPLAIATFIPADYSIDKAGEWSELPDGQKIWRLRVRAEGAIALMICYADFYIPEGGKLFIYNADKTHILGAYTSTTNPPTREFATEFIAGDDVLLEYEAPLSGERPRLQIDRIGYGYNHLSVSRVPLTGQETGPGTSGSCMVNINCEEGDEWQTEKKGICQMVQIIGEKAYICTGTLVNNTAKDLKPYVMSAYHCATNIANGQLASVSDMNQWLFYFHFEHSRCDNTSPAYAPKTMVGCTRRVAIPIEKGSDGLLVELNQAIPAAYDVFFNGWDRSNTAPLSGVGIHHPSGDYMKISTFGNVPIESATWRSSTTREQGARDAHWNVIFDQTTNGYAVTEGGSSGSPLFNENQLVTGTLSGGNSSCEEPDGINLYGKLFYHWNKYSEADTGRMDIWLDPLRTGVTRLGGLSQSGEESPANVYKAPTDVTASVLSGDVHLTWKAPVYQQTIGWSSPVVKYEFGFSGDPFYFGQYWNTDDLQPIDRNTLTAVHFFPAPDVTYELFVRQGTRIYTQPLERLATDQMNTIELDTPFGINARQDLLVAFHAKSYRKNSYPARADEGPAIEGKGNLVSLDGMTWEKLATDQMDANFIIQAVITSEKGEWTESSELRTETKLPFPVSSRQAAIRATEVKTIGSANEPIAAFPQPTGYQIYRDETKLSSVPASSFTYTDKNSPAGSHQYAVSALYGENESKRTATTEKTLVSNASVTVETMHLEPTVFDEQIRIVSEEPVIRLEIYSAKGKRMQTVRYPGTTLYTGSLPPGVYIFRLSTRNETKTFRGIKQ